MPIRISVPQRVWLVLFALVVVFLAGTLYQVHFNYRFAPITAGKVYTSGAIPPDELASYVRRYRLETVIDLRRADEQEAVAAERIALQKLGVGYVHWPTGPVPSPETVERFQALMARPEVYPVLIHDRHGVGNAVLFGALYRITFEGWKNERARSATRLITEGSRFDTDARLGRFLRDFVPQ